MYDIVFISYNEPNADANYKLLKDRFPTAKRVDGVKGIHQAHIAAAKKCFSPVFWVVDADAIVLDSFNFDYKLTKEEYDIVHVWRSCNPVNGLEYGYGGVKLLPKKLTIDMDVNSTDMTLNISSRFKAMGEVSNITAFNTDPFTTWRSAFRECCKLALNSDAESLQRLNTWTSTATGDFAENALNGAIAGRSYGQENAANKAALSLINDFDWLRNQYEQTLQPSEKSQQ
jgi:hypothetical protein